jgi:uncharacterized protein involved in cysteine biosynthesis
MGRMFGERSRSVVDWLDYCSVATWISILAIMVEIEVLYCMITDHVTSPFGLMHQPNCINAIHELG